MASTTCSASSVVSRSPKRGICMNEMSPADFAALAPGVSWYYNWDCRPHEDGRTAGLQFIPMVWGRHPLALRRLDQYLASATLKPPVVFALNEPNLKGQAYLTPWHTADQYRKMRVITDEFGIPLVGPHMALGSAENASISAFDPVENRTITYTFMVPFLKATLHYLDQWGITPPGVSIHSYGGLGELKWAVELIHSTFGCPVWVTEYAQWECNNLDQARDYLLEATDYLGNSQLVAGYAWFKDRVPNKPCISLLADAPGKLSPLGEAYITPPAR